MTKFVAVNLSAKQFKNPNFENNVKQILAETEIDPAYLGFEITESILIQEIDKTRKVLNSLKQIGIQFAIDDFGTGYSSLSYLKFFNMDLLKIDQSFTKDIGKIKNSEAIICAIISMGHSLGYKIIAEGVETKVQLDYLKSHHCDEIQGFYIARGMTADKIIPFCKKFSGIL